MTEKDLKEIVRYTEWLRSRPGEVRRRAAKTILELVEEVRRLQREEKQ